MQPIMPSRRLLYLWWAMLSGAALVGCLALSVLSLVSNTLWLCATAAALAVYCVLFAWYLPARLRACSYRVSGGYVSARTGVLTKTERYLYSKNIQFSSVCQSLPGMLLGLYTVRLLSAGTRLSLHGLDKDALAVLSALLPGLPEISPPAPH